jgi:hypothetical protein
MVIPTGNHFLVEPYEASKGDLKLGPGLVIKIDDDGQGLVLYSSDIII